MIAVQTYTRTNFKIHPPLEEKVVVIIETPLTLSDKALQNALLAALWEQYPLWKCPYHAGNPPPSNFAWLRHGFSTPLPEGMPREVGP
jgi:hypothetical protein